MSMYQFAVQQGATALAQAITSSSPEATAAYNAAYQSTTSKLNAREARHTAALNISAIAQDQVLTNTKIKMQKAQAKAQTIISAAAAGVEGGSVDDVMYEADKSAAFAKRSSTEQANQEKETIFGKMSTLNESQFNIEEPEFDLTSTLVGLAGSIDETDLERWGLSIE